MTATAAARTMIQARHSAILRPLVSLNDRAYAATLATMFVAVLALPFARGEAPAEALPAAAAPAAATQVVQLEPVVITGQRRVAAPAVVQLEPVVITGRSQRAIAEAQAKAQADSAASVQMAAQTAQFVPSL